uniref:Uncharacterized protein n=1 Tax=Knipowitschia caucasica TaxID=637954 RepID=A0AAV2LIM9_KNICA
MHRSVEAPMNHNKPGRLCDRSEPASLSPYTRQRLIGPSRTPCSVIGPGSRQSRIQTQAANQGRQLHPKALPLGPGFNEAEADVNPHPDSVIPLHTRQHYRPTHAIRELRERQRDKTHLTQGGCGRRLG